MNDNQEENKPSRKTWDLMIGLTLVLLGSLRLYNRLKTEDSFSLRSLFTMAFIAFGVYLIYKYFQQSNNKDQDHDI